MRRPTEEVCQQQMQSKIHFLQNCKHRPVHQNPADTFTNILKPVFFSLHICLYLLDRSAHSRSFCLANSPVNIVVMRFLNIQECVNIDCIYRKKYFIALAESGQNDKAKSTLLVISIDSTKSHSHGKLRCLCRHQGRTCYRPIGKVRLVEFRLGYGI